jgi:protein-disulfide isomerase
MKTSSSPARGPGRPRHLASPRGERPAGYPRRGLWLGGTAVLVLVVAAIVWAALPRSSGAPTYAIPAGVPRGVTATGDPYLGAPSAPVTMEEYGDFQCPYCGEFARDTEPKIISTYVVPGKVRIVWHTMAFIGQESVWAGEAARCAQDQGKFWDYYMVLYHNQGSENSGAFTMARLAGLAARAHVDANALRACVASNRYQQTVQASDQAAARAGVTSTPTFFVNGRKVTGALPYQQMASIIDAALAQRH